MLSRFPALLPSRLSINALARLAWAGRLRAEAGPPFEEDPEPWDDDGDPLPPEADDPSWWEAFEDFAEDEPDPEPGDFWPETDRLIRTRPDASASRRLDGAMIPPAIVDEIRRLLAQPGFSQRKVALLTGVSRATVGAIAVGRRRDYPPQCDPIDRDEVETPSGPAIRCPSCGGKVYMPCRLCRVRALKAADREKQRRRFDPTYAHASHDRRLGK